MGLPGGDFLTNPRSILQWLQIPTELAGVGLNNQTATEQEAARTAGLADIFSQWGDFGGALLNFMNENTAAGLNFMGTTTTATEQNLAGITNFLLTGEMPTIQSGITPGSLSRLISAAIPGDETAATAATAATETPANTAVDFGGATTSREALRNLTPEEAKQVSFDLNWLPPDVRATAWQTNQFEWGGLGRNERTAAQFNRWAEHVPETYMDEAIRTIYGTTPEEQGQAGINTTIAGRGGDTPKAHDWNVTTSGGVQNYVVNPDGTVRPATVPGGAKGLVTVSGEDVPFAQLTLAAGGAWNPGKTAEENLAAALGIPVQGTQPATTDTGTRDLWLQGYQGRFEAGMAELEKLGGTGHTNIDTAYDSAIGNSLADLASRGLLDTDMVANTQSAINAERTQAHTTLDEQLAGQRIQYGSALSKDLFDAVGGALTNQTTFDANAGLNIYNAYTSGWQTYLPVAQNYMSTAMQLRLMGLPQQTTPSINPFDAILAIMGNVQGYLGSEKQRTDYEAAVEAAQNNIFGGSVAAPVGAIGGAAAAGGLARLFSWM